MIIFRVRIHADHAQREQVLRSLKQIVWQTQAMSGCISAQVCVDAGDKDEVLLIEEWQTQEHLVERLRGENARVVLATMDCSVDPPEVRFDTVSQTKGLEFIAACRPARSDM